MVEHKTDRSWIEEIRRSVIEEMDLSREWDDTEIEEKILEKIRLFEQMHFISLEQKHTCALQVFNSIRKFDVLQELLEQPEITEVLVNGTDRIFYEKNGRMYQWEKQFSTREKLENVIQQMVGQNNKMVNESMPIVDTRLADGSRVNIVLPPVAVDGPQISIRRFPKEPIRMRELIAWDSISEEVAELLEQLVKAKYNIFISGGTGSGKTTFLNALSEFIPQTERIVTIEDAAELQIRSIPNLVRLESRRANFEGLTEIRIRDLIRTALRMRPDRIIVGEVRGEEAIDMINAMNTGHEGSLSTGHANSAEDMLRRLETMVLMGIDLPLDAIRAQIAAGIDIIVHLGRLRDGSRRVLEVQEVMGYEQGKMLLSALYTFQECGEVDGKIKGMWTKVSSLQHSRKLQQLPLF